jgi:hypothetical protein
MFMSHEYLLATNLPIVTDKPNACVPAPRFVFFPMRMGQTSKIRVLAFPAR